MPTPATVRYLKQGTAAIVAHCEGKDSNPCAVTVATPPPTGELYPLLLQMPSGDRHDLFTMNWDGPYPPPNLTDLPQGQGGIVVGHMTRYKDGNPNEDPDTSLVPVTDGSAPVSAPTVSDLIYPAGFSAGIAPEGMWMKPPAALAGTSWRRLYVCDIFKLVGTSFEVSGSGGTKLLGYLGLNGNTTALILAATRWGDPFMTVSHPGSYTLGCQGGRLAGTFDLVEGQYTQGTSPGVIVPGYWLRAEWLLEMNDIGQSNGRLRVQHTNLSLGTPPQMVIDNQNLTIRDATYPGGFTAQRDFVCVFGGSGRAKVYTDILRLAHSRVVAQGLNG